MMRTGLFIAILVALLNILLIVRHTRQNEEAGREELLRSGRTGRFAGLTAVLLAALGINLIISAVTAAMFLANDLAMAGSIVAGVSWGAVGMAFAGIAAIAVQCAKTTRGASGLSGAALGGAFVLAALGSLLGTVKAASYMVVPAWPTWLSPLGWGQLMRPFSENNWEWLAVFGLFTAACIITAFSLAAKRDEGRGILPERRAPAHAVPGLLHPFGLVWRLQRGSLYGWLFGVVAIGSIMGSLTQSVSSSLNSSADIKTFLLKVGGTDQLVMGFLGIVITIISTVITVFAIQNLLRAHADEENGTAEPVLATRISRTRWLSSYILYGLVSSILLLVALGIAEGLAAGLALNDVGHYLSQTVPAALSRLPAVVVFAAWAVCLFGAAPRLANPLSWAVYALAVAAGPPFSALINIPHWAQNLSPFSHVANMPAEPVKLLPLILLSGLALALTMLGLVVFRRRNITSTG
jgi:ABC-2 type transport system permease protein